MMETTESVEDWDVEMIRGIFFCFFYEFLGQTEVDAETQEPLPQLTAPCRDWCRAAGGLARAERVDDVLDAVRRGRLALAADAEAADAAADAEGARLVRALDAGLARANDRAVSNAQRVQKWTLLDADFSIAGGELGEREREPVGSSSSLSSTDGAGVVLLLQWRHLLVFGRTKSPVFIVPRNSVKSSSVSHCL